MKVLDLSDDEWVRSGYDSGCSKYDEMGKGVGSEEEQFLNSRTEEAEETECSRFGVLNRKGQGKLVTVV